MNLYRAASRSLLVLLAIVLLMLCVSSCSRPSQSGVSKQELSEHEGDITLVIGAYSVVKDVFEELLPNFQSYWLQQKGQKIVFQESYEASGTQARAIIGGFEADVAILAMEGDIDKIVEAGFITHDWRSYSHAGMITESIVVLGTRAGNPLGIKDWEDLMAEGVKVLYPNPKTSGGAQWDINAIYGAGLKRSEQQIGKMDPEFAKQFLKSIHRNVESLDKSGRASMAAFEYGVGDVIVTYENELLARIKKGIPYDIVVPRETILIENPAALVDQNVEKHDNREVAEAFIRYLHSEEAQRLFVEHGFRAVDEHVAAQTNGQFAAPEGLFNISYMGGWDEVREKLYSRKGIWYQVLAGQ